jgi:hypothetical protein
LSAVRNIHKAFINSHDYPWESKIISRNLSL